MGAIAREAAKFLLTEKSFQGGGTREGAFLGARSWTLSWEALGRDLGLGLEAAT